MFKIFFAASNIAISLILFHNNAYSQSDVGFIYGKVTTLSGTTYKGQIRWGKEEAFWNDIFNATKNRDNENSYSKYATDKKSKDWWENIDGRILKIWDDTYSSQTHQFTCRFGDIKSISPHNDGRLSCEIKNGVKLNLKGGSNDIGTTVIIYDYELGKVSIRWSKILIVEFEDTPQNIEDKIGEPLYGQVLTSEGIFKGYVQWDKDERLSSDVIEGSSSSGKVEIPFAKISVIENLGNNSRIKLQNGKTITVGGTNDVNKENRGIIVTLDNIGKIEIPWEVFNSFQLEECLTSGSPYSSYPAPQRLKGMVKDLEGNNYEGLIIFDKDEKWDIEHLEGKIKNIRYNIPFREVNTIIPKNESYSYVILKNDKKLILGNLQDVSSKNEGVVIIHPTSSDPTFLDWENVVEIHFE